MSKSNWNPELNAEENYEFGRQEAQKETLKFLTKIYKMGVDPFAYPEIMMKIYDEIATLKRSIK